MKLHTRIWGTDNLPLTLSSPMLRRLALLMAIISLIPSLLIFFITYIVGITVIQHNTRDEAYGRLLTAQYNVHETINDVENAVLSLAINDHFIPQLKNDLQVGTQERVEIRNFLEDSLSMNRLNLSTLYLETETDTVYTSLFNSPIPPASMRLYGSPVEEDILRRSGALLWLGVEPQLAEWTTRSFGRDSIRCAAAIFDFSPSTDCLGILSLFVRTSAFQNDISYLNGNANNEVIVLLDQNRNFITSSRPIDSVLLQDLSEYSGDILDQPSLVLSGQTYISTALQDKETGWYFLSLQSKDRVLLPMTSKTTWMLIPLALLPLLCLLSVHLFSTQLLTSISPLIDTLDQIKKGNLGIRSPKLNDTVLDLIVTALNETMDKYNELVKKSSHQETLLAISRLEILRGQLSPHFLYNTLDSVNWMLIENEQWEMSQIISNLGDLLRYSLKESSETVPLSDELNIIQRYLSICKNRFENRLHYHISVKDNLNTYQLPRFLLQPVVENAVIHGIEKCSESVNISILCYTEADRTIIDITNDGANIPQETKDQLETIFNRSYMNKNYTGTTHIGLANVHERIQLFFGGMYGITLLDAFPHGVLVRITLPHPDSLNSGQQPTFPTEQIEQT